MRKTILAFLLLSVVAGAEPALPARDFKWPTTYTAFKILSVPLDVQWKDGRPYAARPDLVKYLHIAENGESSVDLIEALAEKGFQVRRDHDGTIQALYPDGARTGLATPSVRHSEESVRAVARFQSLLEKQHKVWLQNDPRAALVNRVGQDVAAQARRPIPWIFAIVSDRGPNAGSTGEGVAFVTTGLLDMGLDADELAGILAHEVAHGSRQHIEASGLERGRKVVTIRQYDEANSDYQRAAQEHARVAAEEARMNAQSPNATPSISQSKADDDLDWARRVRNARMKEVHERVQQHQSYQANQRASNHTQERDSDLIGQRYATAAGYKADGLVRALEKLQQRDSRYGAHSLLGSESHPPIGERIHRLRRILGTH